MSCGCATACGCNLVNDDGTISIARSGDTFILAAVQFISSVADGTCINFDVSDGGELTASLILDEDLGTVQIDCTDDGLVANVRIDPAGTLPITQTVDGLRFDCCAPISPTADRRPGDLFYSAAVGQLPDAYRAKGQRIARGADSTPGGLFDALTLYATAAAVTGGSPVVASIPDTEDIQPGMTVEIDGFAGNPTVLSVDSINQITIDENASSTLLGTANVRVFVWGDGGDPTSFFQLPDGRDRTLVASGYGGVIAAAQLMGSQFGTADATIAASMIPAHTHTATGVDAGHTHTGTTSTQAAHQHGAGTANDSDFVTVIDGSVTFRGIAPVTSGNIPTSPAQGVTDAISIPTYPASSGIITAQQGTRTLTSLAGGHSHTFTTDSGNANISVMVNPSVPGAGPTTLPIIQPSLAARLWVQR